MATNAGEGVTRDTSGWTTTIQTINDEKKYLWNYEEVVYSIGSSDISDPIIIGFYGKGADGKSITNIVNYYQITTTTTAPTTWTTTVPMLDPTNRYLWNYEEIIYTTGDPTKTDPAIIGVYGDSGTDAVDFQIYSVDGFEFSDALTSIELKTIVFKAGEKIEDGTYCWKWWNADSDLEDKYEEISNATSSTLVIDDTSEYALTTIKCEMTYDGITYEDYISFTKETNIYVPVIKFLNGSNIIATGEDYVVAYIELYKNNAAEELLYTTNIYVSDKNKINDNIITTDITGDYKEGDAIYFVCQSGSEYDVVLGEYNSDNWYVQKNKYTYINDLYTNTTSPIIFIPKKKISKTLHINYEIFRNDLIIARASAMVMDFNDPIVSDSEPTDPQKGQLWLDTSMSPSILKMWDGSTWVNSGYQNGNTVYTSKPNQYTKGDLWILADGETCGSYTAGSMLKANETSSFFSVSHWEDAMEENTSILNNVKQYFLFNADTGLRIGQSDEKFYVNISSTEMGFYDASSGTAQKVVNISNQSATIKNLTVQDKATFDCEVQFGNFIWKTENNGSLSLAVAT